MLYIENLSNDPTYNLAFEEYIFTRYAGGEGASHDPILLLWQNGPSVIIGRYQNTPEEINADFIRENGIAVVRRNTGGGAVYHDLGNLNYSLIAPKPEGEGVDFDTFTAPVVKALRSAGIDAEKSGRNDILAGGKKFSGNAQHISKGRVLHHGTLMFDVHMEDVAKALRVKEGKFRSKATKSVRSRVTNLKPLFSDEAGIDTVEDFKALLVDWFDREYGLETRELMEEQKGEILALQKEKYGTYDWNYGKSPAADVSRGDFFSCGEVMFHFSLKAHRIEKVKITGDFFSGGDIEELEEAFIGVPYDRESVLAVLRGADLNKYLGDVTAEELADVIV